MSDTNTLHDDVEGCGLDLTCLDPAQNFRVLVTESLFVHYMPMTDQWALVYTYTTQEKQTWRPIAWFRSEKDARTGAEFLSRLA